MVDLGFCVIVILFFAVSFIYVAALKKLQGDTHE